MKGIQGLIVAVVLGLVGAAANFYYLNTEAQKKDMVAFIGIKKGVIIGRGERLAEDNLVKVEIPANHVGNLKDYACLWNERISVQDMPVCRTLDSKAEGVLLLQADVRTPPPELQLGKGERGEYIAVPRNCDTSLMNPGDRISIRVAMTASPRPTLAPRPAAGAADAATGGTADPQPKPEESEAASQAAGSSETFGPFVIVSIGNRLGTVQVMKAAKIPQVQQNVLMIRVSKSVPQEVDKFEKFMTDVLRFGPNCYTISLLGKE